MSTTLIHRRRRRCVLRRSPLRPLRAPPNGGNCSIRGATRRRHADSGLLMVQTPPIALGGEGGCGARREASGGEGGCGARGRRQGLLFGRDAPSCPDKTRGNCSIRGATRRRHADSGLLMVQNPPIALGGEGGCGARREASGGEGGCGVRGRRQGLAGLRDRPLRAALACGDLAGGPPPPGARRFGGRASRRSEARRREIARRFGGRSSRRVEARRREAARKVGGGVLRGG